KTAYEAPAPSASATPGTDTSAAEPLSAISATPTAASAVATAHAAGLGAVDEPAAESGERRRGAECCDRAHRDSGVADGGEAAELVARHAEAAHGERPAREAARRAAGGEPHREEQQRRPERHSHGTDGERGSTVRAERLRGAGGAEAERGQQNLEARHRGIVPRPTP